MEKKDELAKEERTIFIVLAIIIIIAIGVLLIWYFTKDKDTKEKDSDTKSKTIETKKKEETDDETPVTYVRTEENKSQPVVVYTSNIVQAEDIEVVSTATETVQTPEYQNPYEGVVPYDETVEIYLIGEKINFSGYTIEEVKGRNLEDTEELTDPNNYTLIDDQTITFNTEGKYVLTISDVNGEQKEVTIIVNSNETLISSINTFIDGIDLKDEKYYDSDLYNQFQEKLENLKVMSDDELVAKKLAYLQTKKLYEDLIATFNTEDYKNDKTTELGALIADITEDKYESLEAITELLDQAKAIIEDNSSVEITKIEELITKITEEITKLTPKTIAGVAEQSVAPQVNMLTLVKEEEEEVLVKEEPQNEETETTTETEIEEPTEIRQTTMEVETIEETSLN